MIRISTDYLCSKDDSFRYLCHYGTKGQKWGIRRYQNPDGSLTAAGKKRYSINADGSLHKLSRSERKSAKQFEKKKSQNLEKARKAKAAKAEYNKSKKEAIQSGNAEKISKYFNELTPKELETAMSRIDAKQKFEDALNKQSQTMVSAGKRKADSVISKISTITNYSEKLIDFYNVAARVNNAFNSETYLPTVSKDGKDWAGNRKAEEAKKAREVQKSKDNAAKEKVLNLGSAEDVLKYAKKHGNVSSDELGKVINRIHNEDKLKSIAEANRKKKENK